MADNEGGENASRGTDWEVVSLTASAYAAAPGPKEVELKDDDDNNNAYREDDGAETSHALFMSGHFVFPPTKHENLSVELEESEIHNEEGKMEAVSDLDAVQAGRSSGKDEENWTLKGITVPDEFPGMQFFDDKALDGSTYGENVPVPRLNEQGLDFSPDISLSPTTAKDNKHDGSNLPCGAWWKRRVASLYAHAKEANTFWSIFIAAAVMGFVILGQRWQQEGWQALQIKWQISINDERRGRMLGPIFRLKDVIVGGHRRGSVIRGSSSSKA
ncbi:hypothetical protein CIPAW_01G062900 [Carya illinoinensis]|uniref:ATG8-interacting protein 1 n=1 Tax=Carya illinoinensis TaxID=32201 RepID=A0A8T1RKK1_CARIL|nr:hypothetical protein CIPAW_01G062900 [Carya illinoinensis]KAG6666894.1 hypothetical protein CIPAW_01G062900 [Carya illinoinensis]